MKNIYLILMIIASLVFFNSCKKDNKEPNEDKTGQTPNPNDDNSHLFDEDYVSDTVIFQNLTYLTVKNAVTGKIWLDRNLGATQAATSPTDENAYGDLYQWGRGADGHQLRTSEVTSTLSDSDTPGHDNFIKTTTEPFFDWRLPQNDDLWQGTDGINNPCPSGYRLPTATEWEEERQSWTSNNGIGAYGSPLRLPVAGYRNNVSSIDYSGSDGYYWGSTVDDIYASYLLFREIDAYVLYSYRVAGHAIRCIKD